MSNKITYAKGSISRGIDGDLKRCELTLTRFKDSECDTIIINDGVRCVAVINTNDILQLMKEVK